MHGPNWRNAFAWLSAMIGLYVDIYLAGATVLNKWSFVGCCKLTQYV